MSRIDPRLLVIAHHVRVRQLREQNARIAATVRAYHVTMARLDDIARDTARDTLHACATIPTHEEP